MRFALYSGDSEVGLVEWVAPGQVELDVPDASARSFLGQYFSGETVHLAGLFEANGETLVVRRRDRSPAVFETACIALHSVRGYEAVRLPSSQPLLAGKPVLFGTVRRGQW